MLARRRHIALRELVINDVGRLAGERLGERDTRNRDAGDAGGLPRKQVSTAASTRTNDKTYRKCRDDLESVDVHGGGPDRWWSTSNMRTTGAEWWRAITCTPLPRPPTRPLP